MRIHLAGCEGSQFSLTAARAGIKNFLFSYYHIQSTSPDQRIKIFNAFNECAESVICDSGLFTLMFGAGKGGNYDLPFMEAYTHRYIETAKKFGIKNLNIVECDVHKILGMDAVFKLREIFENCGLNVVYVWHREEGIDGLIKMANRYKFIALSVPELRILFKGKTKRYQDGVFNLLYKLRNEVNPLPRIHLLGNTITETMKTQDGWSCDSTSWLSAGRFGGGCYWERDKFISVRGDSGIFNQLKEQEVKRDPELIDYIKTLLRNENSKWEYYLNAYTMARQFKYCQDYLDTRYPWIGDDKLLKGRL